MNFDHDKISLDTFNRYSANKDAVENNSFFVGNMFNIAFVLFLMFLLFNSLKY